MNKAILFLVLSFLSFSTFAQWPHNRLDKLKGKNPQKCISVAKRYIKLFPEKASSYYFVSVVYFDQLDSARNLRGEYIKMGNALLYARKFEKYADEEIKKKVSWDDVVNNMESKSNEIMAALREDERSDLALHLSKKLDRLEDIETIEIVKIENRKKPELATVTIPESERLQGQFYGLPSGEENIPSDNLAEERKMLALINEERTKQNMKPLEFQEDLARACRYHAYDLGTQGYFGHNSYDRTSGGKLVEVGRTFVRIRKFYNETFVNSENIAGGNQDAKNTFEQWYKSKGHYDNMFNPISELVGIGVVRVPDSPYEYYWVFCTAK